MKLADMNAELVPFDGAEIRILRFRVPGTADPVEVLYSDKPAHRLQVSNGVEVLVHQRVSGTGLVGLTLIPALSLDGNGARGRVADGQWVNA